MSIIKHWGFASFCEKDNPIPYYETIENDELIQIKSSDGTIQHANSLVIEALDTQIFVELNNSGFCAVIDPNQTFHYDFKSISEFRVLGNSGQKLRWYALFY